MFSHSFIHLVFNLLLDFTPVISCHVFQPKQKKLNSLRICLEHQTWLPCLCFGTQAWQPLRHVKTKKIVLIKSVAISLLSIYELVASTRGVIDGSNASLSFNQSTLRNEQHIPQREL